MKSTYNSIVSVVNVLCVIVIVILVSVLILDIRKKNMSARKKEDFDNDNNNSAVSYEKDRTLLYGSLFLDKLDEQIKNMTDPRITYDEKRIDIIKYSDILM
jgi:hypothetical protein